MLLYMLGQYLETFLWEQFTKLNECQYISYANSLPFLDSLNYYVYHICFYFNISYCLCHPHWCTTTIYFCVLTLTHNVWTLLYVYINYLVLVCSWDAHRRRRRRRRRIVFLLRVTVSAQIIIGGCHSSRNSK